MQVVLVCSLHVVVSGLRGTVSEFKAHNLFWFKLCTIFGSFGSNCVLWTVKPGVPTLYVNADEYHEFY